MSENARKKTEYIIHAAFALMVLGGLYVMLKYIVGLILPFLIAFIMVSALHPLIRWMHSRLKINQKFLSVAFMALLYLMVLGLVVWLALQIIFLLQGVLTALPGYYLERIAPTINNLWVLAEDLFENTPPAWKDSLDMVQNSLINGAQSLVLGISQRGVSFVTGFINAMPSVFIALLFTVMLSFFISLQYNDVIGFIGAQLSPEAADFALQLKSIFKKTVLRYLRAFLILMSITFAELSVGLSLIGVQGAVGVAAGIAVFDVLPVFGTGGILAPWVFIELVQGNFGKALQLFLLYMLVTFVRNIIEPKVVGDQLGINPIVSLMAIYLGFRLFGVLGMIVCPMLAQILIALNQSGTIQLFRTAPAGEKPFPPAGGEENHADSDNAPDK